MRRPARPDLCLGNWSRSKVSIFMFLGLTSGSWFSLISERSACDAAPLTWGHSDNRIASATKEKITVGLRYVPLGKRVMENERKVVTQKVTDLYEADTLERGLPITWEEQDKEWIRTVRNEYQTEQDDFLRFKRQAVTVFLNNLTIVESTTIVAPEDRISTGTARWIMIGGAVVITLCAICIVVFYCRCQARSLRNLRLRGDSFEANPRATVSVVPSRALRRPQRLNNEEPLNNSAFGPYHPQAPGALPVWQPQPVA